MTAARWAAGALVASLVLVVAPVTHASDRPGPDPVTTVGAPLRLSVPMVRATTTTPTATRLPSPTSVAVRAVVRRTLVDLQVQVSSRTSTTVVLERRAGGTWRPERWATSSATGRHVFTGVPFSRALRVQAFATRGHEASRSRTVSTVRSWSAGYADLRVRGASMAVTPLGGRTYVVGDRRTGIALSTLKVPVVVANDVRGTGRRLDKRIAIRSSDNPAADRLFAALGEDRRSVMRRHLRRYGDDRTVVHPRQPGLTRWGVGPQSVYASNLACSPAARPVLAHMRRVVEVHRFGLDRTRLATRTAQKVGIGDDVVRQLAVVRTSDGRVYGVSILATGGQRAATAKVDRIARWVANRLTALPARTCSTTR